MNSREAAVNDFTHLEGLVFLHEINDDRRLLDMFFHFSLLQDPFPILLLNVSKDELYRIIITLPCLVE